MDGHRGRPRGPSLTFLGGAGTVTGSKFLVECEGTRLLVDCGLFQGQRDLRRLNWEPLSVEPETISAVVLTHAHLDHCGYLPALQRQGFRGDVLCTTGTRDLAEIVLRDSAHLQEEDARTARDRGSSRHTEPRPLYDTADVEKTLSLFRPVEMGKEVGIEARTDPGRPGHAVTVTFEPAGHILGSSLVHLSAGARTALFSGDLGRGSHPLLPGPAGVGSADAVIVESTYGDRRHPSPDHEALAEILRRALGRGGSVLVPAFAIDRTELVLIELGRLMRAGLLPRVPVFVDSPMALRALKVYRRALGSEMAPGSRHSPEGEDVFELLRPDGLVELATAQESQRLGQPRRPCIIVSASGMASGGRVVHHLENLLPDERNIVVVVGYQAEGTRGRDLVDGAEAIKCLGRYVPVRAEVHAVDWMSVHADSDDVMSWLRTAERPPDACYVVHGEPRASGALRRRIHAELGWVAVVPRRGERVLL